MKKYKYFKISRTKKLRYIDNYFEKELFIADDKRNDPNFLF